MTHWEGWKHSFKRLPLLLSVLLIINCLNVFPRVLLFHWFLSLCIGTAGWSSKFSPGERWRIALMHCHPHRHVPLLSEALCHSHPHHSGPAQVAIFHTHFHLLHSPYLLPHFLQPQQSPFTLPPLSHTARPLSAWRDRTYCVSVRRTYQTKMTLPASAGCIRETTCYHCNPFPEWPHCLNWSPCSLPILFLLLCPSHRTPSVVWFSWL